MIKRPYRFVGPKRIRSELSPIAKATALATLRSLLAIGTSLPAWLVSGCFGVIMRVIGPKLPRHAVGLRNLAAALPEKTRAEHEKILAGMWNNLGRVGGEFIFLEHWSRDLFGSPSVVVYDEATANRFLALRNDNIGALLFSAHLGNWELPAIVAAAAGLETMVLYRPPSIQSVAYSVGEIRKRVMGETVAAGLHAPFVLAKGLREGKHVGMLVDQHDSRGVPVTFFGQVCRTNPLIALLAREYDVPIHGVYAKRIAACRFKVELTPRLMPARDDANQVDIIGTMQLVTKQIEAWIREVPDQWLWIHRRWRAQ